MLLLFFAACLSLFIICFGVGALACLVSPLFFVTSVAHLRHWFCSCSLVEAVCLLVAVCFLVVMSVLVPMCFGYAYLFVFTLLAVFL